MPGKEKVLSFPVEVNSEHQADVYHIWRSIQKHFPQKARNRYFVAKLDLFRSIFANHPNSMLRELQPNEIHSLVKTHGGGIHAFNQVFPEGKFADGTNFSLEYENTIQERGESWKIHPKPGGKPGAELVKPRQLLGSIDVTDRNPEAVQKALSATNALAEVFELQFKKVELEAQRDSILEKLAQTNKTLKQKYDTLSHEIRQKVDFDGKNR